MVVDGRTARRHPRPAPRHEPREAEEDDRPERRPRRSNAAVPAAAVLLVVGLLVGPHSALVPALLGLGLLYVALTFVSSRLNPFSIGFYLTVKPAWTAILSVGLIGLLLVVLAYADVRRGLWPLLP